MTLIFFFLGLLSDRPKRMQEKKSIFHAYPKKNARKKKSIFHAYPTILSVLIQKNKKTVLSVNVLAHYKVTPST